MIQFTVSLTPNQILCLRAIREATDCAGEASACWRDIPHFVTGTRMLLAERLVEHVQAPEESRRDPAFKWWRITRKGRLLLEVIELDLQDTAEALSSAAALPERPDGKILQLPTGDQLSAA